MEKNLNSLKQEISKLDNEISSKQKTNVVLIECPEVRKYIKLNKELMEADSKRRILDDEFTVILQSQCEHPLWYLGLDDGNPLEDRTYWICTCVECGKTITEMHNYFNNKRVIKGDVRFTRLYKQYYSYGEVKKRIWSFNWM